MKLPNVFATILVIQLKKVAFNTKSVHIRSFFCLLHSILLELIANGHHQLMALETNSCG